MVPLVLVVPVVLQCGSIGSSCVSSESRSFLFIVVIVFSVFFEVPVVLAWLTRGYRGYKHNNKQLLDEVEQNIVICLWRADQLFAEAEG